jgi:hypothetical protein
MGRAKDEIERAATATAREANALAVIDQRRLARARTLEMVASAKVAAVPDNDPKRAELQRKMRELSAKIRLAERDHEAAR